MPTTPEPTAADGRMLAVPYTLLETARLQLIALSAHGPDAHDEDVRAGACAMCALINLLDASRWEAGGGPDGELARFVTWAAGLDTPNPDISEEAARQLVTVRHVAAAARQALNGDADDVSDRCGKPLPGLAEEVVHKDWPGRPLRELSESGLLWLINAVVFHPRGFAFALAMDTRTGEVTGWDVLGDGSQPWSYEAGMLDKRFAAAEATLASSRRRPVRNGGHSNG